jgi:zinc transporter 7
MSYCLHRYSSTFMGIAIHNMTTSAGAQPESIDLAAGVRQNASGILNTTVQLGDLVTS